MALRGRHYAILIIVFLVKNDGISPWMKTPRALRRPLRGIDPVEFRVVPTLHSIFASTTLFSLFIPIVNFR